MMKSMQVVDFGDPLVEVDGPRPTPQGHEVLLKVLATGVCHTDLHLWHGGYDLGAGRTLSLAERGVKLPLTMGHEIVGVVESVGADVSGIKPGDRYIVYPWLGCGSCQVCQDGAENLCLKPRTIGINLAGGYADYVLIPEARYLVNLQDLDPVNAAPLACSGLTCFSALRKFGDVVLSRTPLVVIGAGGLGLMCLKLLAGIGAMGAVVVEPDPVKRQAAMDAGAIATVDPGAENAADQIRQAVGRPVEAVLDFVANPQTAQMGFDVLTKGGKLVLIGLFGGSAPWSLPLIPMKAITIQGSYVGSQAELQELVDLVSAKKLDLIPVEACGIHAVGDALHALQQGKIVGRMVMTP